MVSDSRVLLVRAPNPSPMTLTGTNSYLIDCGRGKAICIDPGPAMARHVDALLDAARGFGARIELVCVTHGHPDHAPAAAMLASVTGARVAAHPRAKFAHDDVLDGARLQVGDVELLAVDAPGHTFDHLVFYEPRERALFTGDVVLGTGTVVIAPPGGAMRPYVRTLERLARDFPEARTIFGGHGPPVTDPAAKLREYIAHRGQREDELLAALAAAPQTIPDLVRSIYAQTEPVLFPAAARQMLAYLIALEAEGRVVSREIDRAMTAEERTMLNPEWERIVGAEDAAVVREELGAALRLDALREYALTG